MLSLLLNLAMITAALKSLNILTEVRHIFSSRHRRYQSDCLYLHRCQYDCDGNQAGCAINRAESK